MHNRRSTNVQGMVFGGIMAGLVVLFALVPMLSIFISIPLVLTYVRFGGRTAVMTAVVATLLTAMFKGPIQPFLVMVPAGVLPGLVLGYGIRNKFKPLTVGLLAIAIAMVGYGVTYGVTRVAVLEGRDPFEVALENPEIRRMSDEMMRAYEQLAEQLPQDTEAQQKSVADFKRRIEDFRTDPIAVMWALLPLAVFIGVAPTTWLTYMLCRWVLPRFGHSVPKFGAFSEFRLGTWFVWVFVLASMGSAYAGQSLLNAPWWVKVVNNVLPFITFMIFAYALAVAYGWLRIKRQMAKGPAVALALVPLFLGQMGMQLYFMLALWDTIFDFRGLGHGMWKRPEETP
jgi:hypothetical protein